MNIPMTHPYNNLAFLASLGTHFFNPHVWMLGANTFNGVHYKEFPASLSLSLPLSPRISTVCSLW